MISAGKTGKIKSDIPATAASAPAPARLMAGGCRLSGRDRQHPCLHGGHSGRQAISDISPFCRHFGVCGGCSLQDLAYEDQLKLKAEKLNSLPGDFFKKPVAVHPSPSLRFYRNKMEFGFSRQVEGVTKSGGKAFASRLGLKSKKRWDRVLDLEECYLLSPEIPELLKSVRKWARIHRHPYYDLRTHHGLLRHLVVREAKNTGQRMITLITTDGHIDADGFVAAVREFYPATTVCRGINAGISDVAVSHHLHILHGLGFITEKLNITSRLRPDPLVLSFKISPFSFFQTNTLGAEKLYSMVRSIVEKARPGVLYDLYGGAGGFSLACADIVPKCVCVEENAGSVEDGKNNAFANNITNVEFVCAKTEGFLSTFNPKSNIPATTASAGRQYLKSVVILDPPRSGLHPKALKKLAEAGIPSIIYVSCNPVSLARDLKELVRNYSIDSAEGLDLFPHTEHVETIAHLTLQRQ
ncbi:MAG: 23S rRNA (uracil(1939)-C(5))-methyltransferase RlmD [bacterium]